MKINSIKLNNIRSYTNQEIKFPEGSILLSGNIGSGKTSLLLAMDFVLFGLRKGSLSGNSLLRKGEDNGSVELNFQIKDKNIVIKRTLKRSSKGINQSSGFFNNEELTPIEIKQRVIDLFNYPTDSLKKTKDLIYNYTIYTPQEEMKSILLSDSENRLNILRKVFGIDKYKRVIENSKILTSNLKEKKKEFTLLSEDLDKIKLERENKQNRVNEINFSLENLNKDLEEIRRLISLKKFNLNEL